MLHLVVVTYVACFAAGVTLIVVSGLAARHLALPALRAFSVMWSGATLILVVEAAKTYETAVGTDFGAGLHIMAAILALLGNFGLCRYLLSLVLQVVRAEPSRPREILLFLLSAAVALLGAVREMSFYLWPRLADTLLTWRVAFVALIVVHLLAGGILLAGYSRIQHARLELIIRSYLVYLGVFTVLAVVQIVVQNFRSVPAPLRDHPVDELLYYLGFVVMSLFFLARYFSQPTEGEAISLSIEFVQRFGISHRERDIIEMMGRGFSNSAIAEKLFISTTTVKNHVYHIYRKTGVGNKVQLVNLINSLK
ncbi:MAG TPA: LuxR C-terminal-related transcriptional regulator [Spirochaetia bacterium]|nr:LuxR C-terminal-related transcriptional regulator [Spirochaetia bacterium]